MTTSVPALLQTNVSGYPRYEGKVRDVYDLGDDRMAIIATDRVSALDWVFPNGIPGKGVALTRISSFWFGHRLMSSTTSLIRNHFISARLRDFPREFRRPMFFHRSMLCKKAEVLPYECIVRGYLAGSALDEYRKNGGWVSGIKLPKGLLEGSELERPIFTPSTKAASGHDQNITFGQMEIELGHTACAIRAWCLRTYCASHACAQAKGILIADTKFEFGRTKEGELIVVDEVLTPDSSRFWLEAGHHPGMPQPSLDKQPVRDWLKSLPESAWDRKSPPPPLPDEQVMATSHRYEQICRLLCA